MGRYYQTDKPVFVQDTIMRPDYNLLERSLGTVQKDYDTQQAIADKIMNIDFNHLNSEEENENAAVAKDYYLQNANEIASLMMNDKNNYRKYMGRLKDLSRDLQKDFSEGPIGLMQASYNQEKAWREANKKTLETNPALYNALYREAQKNWGGNSITKGVWQQENALKQFDQQKIEDNIQKLVADIKKSSVQTTDGRYKTTIDNEVKYLSEDDILNYAMNKVLSDPEALAYFRQAQRVGIGNYFNQDDSLNTTGGQLGSWLQGLRSYAYKQESYNKKIDEDKYGLIVAEEAKEKRVAKYKKDLEAKPEDTSYFLQAETQKIIGGNTLDEQRNSVKDLLKKDPRTLNPEQRMVYDAAQKQITDEFLKWGRIGGSVFSGVQERFAEKFGVNKQLMDRGKQLLSKGESKLNEKELNELNQIRQKIGILKAASQNIDNSSAYLSNEEKKKLNLPTDKAYMRIGDKAYLIDNVDSSKIKGDFITSGVFGNYDKISDVVVDRIIGDERLKNLATTTFFNDIDVNSKSGKQLIDAMYDGTLERLQSGVAARDLNGNWNIDKNNIGAEKNDSWYKYEDNVNTLQQLIKVVPKEEFNKYFNVKYSPSDGTFKLIVKDKTLGGRMDNVDGWFGGFGTRVDDSYVFIMPGSTHSFGEEYDRKYKAAARAEYAKSPEAFYQFMQSTPKYKDTSRRFAVYGELVRDSYSNMAHPYRDFPLPGSNMGINVRVKRVKDGDNYKVVYAPYNAYNENPNNIEESRYTELTNSDNAAMSLMMKLDGIATKDELINNMHAPRYNPYVLGLGDSKN